jgi:HTH-type transcriptional regulator, sugar sensing transcriptional regulator
MTRTINKTTGNSTLLNGRRVSTGAIVERLNTLGFTKYEAVAYLLLLEHQPATAYEISKRGALTKGNTYTALESLVAKGAAQPVSHDPVRYAAVAPETLFRRLSRSMTELCRDLTGALTTQRRQTTEHVWTLEGEQRIEDRIVDMLDRAKRQIWIKGPDHRLTHYLPAIRSAIARGVKVLVILFGDERGRDALKLGARAKVYLHEGSGHMLAVGASQFVVSIDFAEALVADFGDLPHGVYTRSDSVVFMAETMIRHEVYLAEIMQAYGDQIEQRFGKDLMRIRAKYLPAPLSRRARASAAALSKGTRLKKTRSTA